MELAAVTSLRALSRNLRSPWCVTLANGTPSCSAECTAMEALVAPGPRLTKAAETRPVMRAAIIAASGTAVEPSYIEALATSIPVSWQTSVWNSKIACSVPWLISGW